MAESDSPQLRRERLAGVVTVSLVFLALPTLAVLIRATGADDATSREEVYWFAGAFVVGAVLPMLRRAPFRALGLAPLAALVWLAVLVVGAAASDEIIPWPWLHGALLGIIIGAVVRGRRGPSPFKETLAVFLVVLLGGAIASGFTARLWALGGAGVFVGLVSICLVCWTLTRLFRPFFESMLEPLLCLSYRIRVGGPGLVNFPRTGPCIVFANHACWFDPLFLAKVLPRPSTPMMTGRFYDLPIMRWLMVMFGVIRVPEKALKKDAPEIQEAIAALDRGECLLIFPEGYLRRTEEKPLRRFGQGIWQILKARPDTPVYACWIEGAWGSYTSYRSGPPTKNKRRDFLRRIDLGISASAIVPAEVLSDHMPTRLYLMNLVLAARSHLGLPPLPEFEMRKAEEKAEEAEE